MSLPVRGFISHSNGKGFRKYVKLDMTNPDFFKDMFQKNIVETGWIDDPATLNIIISFFVYNPNLYLI